MQSDRQRIYIYEVTRRVSEILHYIWDPIGVRGVPQARDEYDSYVHKVFSLLERGASEPEISQFLSDISTEAMGFLATEATATHNAEISRLLVQHFSVLKKQYERD
jgi:hypothetical protein